MDEEGVEEGFGKEIAVLTRRTPCFVNLPRHVGGLMRMLGERGKKL